ncbi:MAG: hypothetical protein ACHQ2E_05750 [Gemmatimonadales bacterium]
MTVGRYLSRLLIAMAGLTAVHADGVSAQGRPWAAGLQAAWNGFSGGATDSLESRVLPSDRFGFSALGTRELGEWVLRLELSVAPGHLAGSDSGSTVELVQLKTSMPRYRIEPLVGRKLANLGEGAVVLYLGPTLDWWRLEGFTRFTIGGEVRLALQAPLGRLVLENYIGFGLAPQPFPSEELDPAITTHTLETLALGLSLRVRL